MTVKGRLILFCGKMGAGKSTLSKAMAKEHTAVWISEDEWLAAHYPGKINTFGDYIEHSRLIKPVVKGLVQGILQAGTTVVMDFPANTVKQRQWLLSLSQEIEAPHELIYLNMSDELCLSRLSKRRVEQPERAAFDTEDVFHQVSRFFEAPSAAEGLTITERTPSP